MAYVQIVYHVPAISEEVEQLLRFRRRQLTETIQDADFTALGLPFLLRAPYTVFLVATTYEGSCGGRLLSTNRWIGPVSA